jgi:hypothetical protein
MKASYAKNGETYQPAIKHDSGKRETLWGPPLGTRKRALFYAQVAINERREAKRRKVS